MMRILLVTNIISPYRQHLYNRWAADCRRRDIDFQVAFMARGEPDRNWEPTDYPLAFPHRFHRGLHWPWPRRFKALHVNPGIWWSLLFGNWDIVISGGYKDPTQLVATCFPKRKRLFVLWSEGNRHSEGMRGQLGRALKRSAIRRFDAYAVPGRWAREYLQSLCPVCRDRPFVPFPNTVDEQTFRAMRNVSVPVVMRDRKQLGIPDGNRVLLFVGSLEAHKGIDKVIAATREMQLPLTMLLVGEGDMQDELLALAEQSALDVRLMGYKHETDVRWLMGLSDGLILPSLRDCWPLVVVEALMSALPVLVSNRVGNVPDLVEGKDTGWLFDVSDPASIRAGLQRFATVDEEQLRRMGCRGAKLADEHLSTDVVVSRLNERLLELLCRKRGGLPLEGNAMHPTGSAI